ncbi:MAG TPA: hypothetical protein DER01_15475 [Phycisphaerales bacterium]|nr:hypothetical protein [Phycisphaerales bacterium]
MKLTLTLQNMVTHEGYCETSENTGYSATWGGSLNGVYEITKGETQPVEGSTYYSTQINTVSLFFELFAGGVRTYAATVSYFNVEILIENDTRNITFILVQASPNAGNQFAWESSEVLKSLGDTIDNPATSCSTGSTYTPTYNGEAIVDYTS